MWEPIDLQERTALRGKMLLSSGRGPRPGRAGRVCSHASCRTVLSIYNDGDRCWEHTSPTPYLLKIRRVRAGKLPA
jgi:hypothetical protein